MSASQQVSSSAASPASGEVKGHRRAFHARALSEVIGQAIFLRSRPLICDTYIPGWLDQLRLNRIFIDPIQMVRQLHDGMTARVTDNGAVSEAFAVTNGVKQECVLAPTLFSLMFSAMLMDAYRDERPGIRIAYRTDGHLLNQRRTHFQSRVSTTTVHELVFADDCALNTTSEEGMQSSMDRPAACENFGLVINTQKTVVVHQPPPNTAPPHNALQSSVNGTQLQVVNNSP
nr:unnamed protein product [Spirometra erinaceieuropaei]